MGKPDNQPAAEKSIIKPYKEERPYDLALLDRRPDDLASLVEMNLLRRMRASSPYGASSDTLKPKGGADIFLDHSGSTYIIPKLSLYSTGLMPPKVILIRSSLYQ